MINPLGIFEKVKEGYISYIKTAFGTRYEEFESNRENLLNTDKVLYRQPWIEPLLEYKSAEGKEIKNLTEHDLSGFTKKNVELFNGFVSKGLFTGNFPLYEHQYRMLQTALEGNNCVITSGTGSGKTEAFLLPLIAYLLKDLSKYIHITASVNEIGPHSYRQGPTNIILEGNNAKLSDRVLQRTDQNRPQVMKALIVYPMNALVEDQLTRLRMTLDNDDIRQFCDEKLNGNRIFFGRYNSTTPVSGKLSKENEDGEIVRNKSKWNQLATSLGNIQMTYDEIESYLISDEGQKLSDEKKLELKTNFQRLDGAEMRSRFDMHQTPPDILITNFSMLSIVLMRAIESGMLEETKKWLECSTDWDLKNLSNDQREKEKEERIFHIIIDELHLYRGTPGTEISYLLRLLYSRLNLDPSSSKVRFLASSASLDGQEGSQEYKDSQSFLKGFFGIDKEMKVIDGTFKLPKEVKESIDPSEFIKLAELSSGIFSSDEEVFIDLLSNKIDEWLQCEINEGVPQLLAKINNDENLKSRLIYAFKSKDKGSKDYRFRPFPVFNKKDDEDKTKQFISLGRQLFGDLENDEEIYKAIKGLLLLRGLFDTKHGAGIICNLPRFRMHFFIRNIEGLWTTLKNDESDILSSNRNEDPFNQLLEFSKIKHDNKRVYESLYCENCGTTFIGGTKIKYTDKKSFRDEIITTPPEIESIPEKSQSAMVERRTQLDYAVFWPKYINEDEIILELLEEDLWEKRYLGINDGKLYFNKKPNTVQGLYFNPNNAVEPSNEVGTALPNSCPSCAADYQYRKKRKSPIRGFRTGFGKTNQILAKELFTAIPDTLKQPRKLVAFSDSREESARFANDIEKENYNQIIKELLLDQRDETILAKELLVSIQSGNKSLTKSLLTKMDKDYASRINKANKSVSDDDGFEPSIEDKMLISDVKQSAIQLDDLVDKIIFGLVKKGINPAGPAASKERLEVREGLSYNEKTEHWKDCFNWQQGKINEGRIVDRQSKDKLMSFVRIPVYKEISSFIFGRLFYSMESSALGMIKVATNVKSSLPSFIDDFVYAQALNTLARILGDNFKHNKTENNYIQKQIRNYSDLSKKRPEKKYIKGVASRLSIDDEQLGNALWNSLTNEFFHYDGVLKLETLRIYFATDDDKVYKCPNCKTVHLHQSAGICKSCFELLPKTSNIMAKEARKDNFYASQLLDKHEIVRMRCEELTGQTDNQLERQRLFKGIITGDNKIVEEIDLLSVTTTLEVGVDIGSLQAVYQGNMSPMRFNYQQRVGRAGRAGQAFNIALTFCRGRSHDEYFFNNPERMTGDLSPVPFLSQSQDQILYRMIIKGVLQKYFENFGASGSVHGEFGKIEDFFNEDNDNFNKLKEWIGFDDNWRGIYDALTLNLFVNNDLYLGYNIDGFKLWIKETFYTKFSNIQEVYGSGDLSEALADSGILPMSGMPTGLRNLILGFEKKSDTSFEAKTISRPIERAIFDFAPGAQKTKDKRIYTSIGLSPAISEIYRDFSDNGTWKARYFNEGAAYKNPVWVIVNSQNNILRTLDYIEGQEHDEIDENCERAYLVVSPNAFRTDWSKKPQDREVDQEISTSKPLLFSEAINPDDIGKIQGNCIVGIAPSDFTWRLNTNGNEEFHFLETTDKFEQATFNNQLLELGLKKKLGFGFNEAINRPFISSKLSDETQVGKKLSLGAQKTTNVIRLHPAQLDFSLDINPFHSIDMGKKVSSKGAFHSAAYLLQRCLADLLDVSPEEIELAAITEQQLDDITERSTGRIVLSDELPNGSGFVEYLNNHIDEFFKMCLEPTKENRYTYSFINKEHAESCKDSCYKDLKNYRNLNYHGILDWRLAVGLIRVLSDATYLSGIDGKWDYIEIADWPETADEYARDFAMNLGIDIVENPSFYRVVENIPIISFKDINIVITHPFWNTTNFPNPTALSRVIAECENPARIFFADTFNLNRRMAWCYEEFFKWLKSNNKR